MAGCTIWIIVAAIFALLTLACCFVLFWLYRRYSSAKECLFLLRRLDSSEPRKRRPSVHPPSWIAPPLPPKRSTPTRNRVSYRPPAASPAGGDGGGSSPESSSSEFPDVQRASVIREEEEESSEGS